MCYNWVPATPTRANEYELYMKPGFTPRQDTQMQMAFSVAPTRTSDKKKNIYTLGQKAVKV